MAALMLCKILLQGVAEAAGGAAPGRQGVCEQLAATFNKVTNA